MAHTDGGPLTGAIATDHSDLAYRLLPQAARVDLAALSRALETPLSRLRICGGGQAEPGFVRGDALLPRMRSLASRHAFLLVEAEGQGRTRCAAWNLRAGTIADIAEADSEAAATIRARMAAAIRHHAEPVLAPAGGRAAEGGEHRLERDFIPLAESIAGQLTADFTVAVVPADMVTVSKTLGRLWAYVPTRINTRRFAGVLRRLRGLEIGERDLLVVLNHNIPFSDDDGMFSKLVAHEIGHHLENLNPDVHPLLRSMAHGPSWGVHACLPLLHARPARRVLFEAWDYLDFAYQQIAEDREEIDAFLALCRIGFEDLFAWQRRAVDAMLRRGRSMTAPLATEPLLAAALEVLDATMPIPVRRALRRYDSEQGRARFGARLAAAHGTE